MSHFVQSPVAPSAPLASPPAASRRGVLLGAAGVGAAAAAPASLLAAPAAAAAGQPYLPQPARYEATAVANASTRHLVSRFSYGMTPALRKQVAAAGGGRAWFTDQLSPKLIGDRKADGLRDWFPLLDLTPNQIWAGVSTDRISSYDLGSDHLRWTLLRRMYSRRQLLEVMTEFWLNHFHVYARADLTWLWRVDYDRTVRRRALGRFDELLAAAVLHPSMLVFLDGDLSEVRRKVRPNGDVVIIEKLNENLGRELLELHTVGRETGYSEEEVRDSAYLLTGWQINRYADWKVYYDPDCHYAGRVKVLGFEHANRRGEGRQAQAAYLRYLAHHPATARRIARKLAVRFVSDRPSDGLVDHLAQVFRASGTNIRATLEALIAHPEFASSAGSKVRTPTEDLIATYRALGIRVHRPQRREDAANAVLWQAIQGGQEPFGWQRPDGFPDDNSAWSSTSRVLGSMRFHQALAAGYYPSGNVTYRSDLSWLPERRIRFDLLVDHMSRKILGRPATARILGAACVYADAAPGEIISRDHPVVKWRLWRIVSLLLDTPEHMTR